MWKAISLVLPVLIPSWRFFDAIGPSPRVEWTVLQTERQRSEWRAYMPRPSKVSPMQMLKRLFWNPAWNDALFVVSCAERIYTVPNAHSINEIRCRVAREVAREPTIGLSETFQFRLVFVDRNGADVVFVSDLFPIDVGQSR